MKQIKIFGLILALFISLGAVSAQTPAQNKETAKKILAAVDAGDINTFSKYVSPSVVEHTPPPPGFVKTGSDFDIVKTLIAGFHAGFPDSKTTIKHIIAEGDIVVIHAEFTGTNKGDFMGMPATNKAVRHDQVDIIRFDATGKAVEHWAVVDQLTMLQQLGLIPTGGK